MTITRIRHPESRLVLYLEAPDDGQHRFKITHFPAQSPPLNFSESLGDPAFGLRHMHWYIRIYYRLEHDPDRSR